MVKRLFDIAVSISAMIVLSPVLLIACIGVRLSSPGPILYKANRAGRGGVNFVMHKFRTMHASTEIGSVITGSHDARIFPFGQWLRVLKIDELPQLFDVLIGNMSIVGPRPEDPKIVEKYYGTLGAETLCVAPGLASPGSIYNYTHGHLYLDDADPESSYVTKLLPVKLALEVVYVRNRSMPGDIRIIFRTLTTIFLIAMGKRRFVDPPEMAAAKRLLQDFPAIDPPASAS